MTAAQYVHKMQHCFNGIVELPLSDGEKIERFTTGLNPALKKLVVTTPVGMGRNGKRLTLLNSCHMLSCRLRGCQMGVGQQLLVLDLLLLLLVLALPLLLDPPRVRRGPMTGRARVNVARSIRARGSSLALARMTAQPFALLRRKHG